jgi:hypothetical protein
LYGNAHDEVLYLWGAGDYGFYGSRKFSYTAPIDRLQVSDKKAQLKKIVSF